MFFNSGIGHVELLATLRIIKDLEFCGCENLRSIEIPDNVEYVGEGCF